MKVFQAVSGSHLYGTSRPESDRDFLGVYLPSIGEFFGMKEPAPEISENVKVSDGPRNAVGDLDSKFYSVKRFLGLALQGQTTAIELFFVPNELICHTTPLWEEIAAHKELFITRNTVAPFVGFCRAQAGKATLKGENLRQLKQLIKALSTLTEGDSKRKISTFLDMDNVASAAAIGSKARLFDMKFSVFLDKNGVHQLVVASNKKLTINNTAEAWLKSARILEERYGSRVHAAAEDKYDYKSLYHAFRIAGEAEELLTTGKLSLPRPKEVVDFLMTIRAEKYEPDYLERLEAWLKKIDKLKPTSLLPEKTNYDSVNELCCRLHYKYFCL